MNSKFKFLLLSSLVFTGSFLHSAAANTNTLLKEQVYKLSHSAKASYIEKYKKYRLNGILSFDDEQARVQYDKNFPRSKYDVPVVIGYLLEFPDIVGQRHSTPAFQFTPQQELLILRELINHWRPESNK